MSNIRRIEKAMLLAFKPPKRLSLSEWADSYAYLSAESSAEAEDGTLCRIRKGLWMR
jgi:phage terminase large subunit GpA-like protein